MAPPRPARLDPPEPIDDSDAPAPGRRRAVAFSAFAAAAALAFQLYLLAAWLRAESRPPSWDQAIHLETALDYAHGLARGDLRGLLSLAPKPGMPPFPPLYYLSLQPFLSAAEPANAALWANAGWLALLIASVWGLGLIYFGPWEAAVGAALLSAMPETQWLLRNHLPDLPLAAWIAAAYLAYARSAGFLRWAPSLACGACVGLAFLTKWSAWTYLFPLSWALLAALRGTLTRPRALAAFALAAGACAVWYPAQLAVLLPRLVDASADQAVAVWRGWTWLSYLWILVPGLDAPLWLLALAALALPAPRRAREDDAVLTAWLLTSLAFWTVVPNRQLRFLFPALGPLLLRVPRALPKWLAAAACAWQLFSAANYTYAWVRPVRLDLLRSWPFLSADPPAREDWKAAEILRAAERRREPGRPLANLTLVANDVRFNGPVFNWARKQAGVPGVHVRGVNRRYCELSEFVLIKQGSLGPASVINQLPAVRQAMLAEGSWFRRGYEETEAWRLPDGSEALLFHRRRSPSPPLAERLLRLDALSTPEYTLKGLVLRLGPWDPRRGAYERADLRAESLRVRGLELHGLHAELEGLDFVPLGPEGRLTDIRLLRLERLTLRSAQLRADELAAWIAGKAPALSRVSATFDGAVGVRAAFKGRLPLAAQADVILARDAVEIRVRRAAVGPFPLPLLGRLASYRQSFAPNPEFPFELRVAPLTLAAGRLVIGP
ncbi:MAG: glycosyltransferase family 39 protein [Elusimicrobia bacterium]|nr:glycosyltransferase family 39 protein [Elusimicrobiota bacterium]